VGRSFFTGLGENDDSALEMVNGTDTLVISVA
jgi:hypothetical protein